MKRTTIVLIFIHLLFLSFSQAPQKIIEKEPGTQHYFGSSGDIHGAYAVVTGTRSSNPNS